MRSAAGGAVTEPPGNMVALPSNTDVCRWFLLVAERPLSPAGMRGTDWAIINGACPELPGTEWESKPEFCPTLSQVVQPEIVLPGIASRAAVQEEIERVRVVKVLPLWQVE